MKTLAMAAVAAVLALTATTRGATYTWNDPTGGLWTSTDSSVWTPTGLPGTGDNIVLGDIAGQGGNYFVRIGDSTVKTLDYGDLTIGSGTVGGYTEDLRLGRPDGLLDVNNCTVNTDGILTLAVWANLGLGSGATFNLHGLLKGGSQNDSYGSGIYSRNTGNRATFVNRGSMVIGGSGYGLRFTNVDFDNVGQTISTGNGEVLLLNSVSIYGGTIQNSGITKLYGGAAHAGASGNPISFINNVGGTLEIRPSGTDYFDLTSYGTTTITNGAGLVVQAGQQIVADGGSVNVDTLANPTQINGMLGLYNGGQFNVATVDVTLGTTGYIDNQDGTINMQTGNLTIDSTQSTLFNATGTEVVFSGTDQQFGIASADQGLTGEGFIDNFMFEKLTLSGTGTLTLTAAAGDALYLDTVDFVAGNMALDIGTNNLYVLNEIITPGGTFDARYSSYGDGAFAGLLTSSGGSIQIIPEPATGLILTTLAGIGLLRRRRF